MCVWGGGGGGGRGGRSTILRYYANVISICIGGGGGCVPDILFEIPYLFSTKKIIFLLQCMS